MFGGPRVPSLWGTVLAGTIPKIDVSGAKKTFQQFVTHTGIEASTNTYDITIGYHTGEKEWKVFLRAAHPDRWATWPSHTQNTWPGTTRNRLCYRIKEAQKYLRIFDCGEEHENYHAEMALLERVTQIMVYKGVPFLLKKDGDLQQKDYHSYQTIMSLDKGGLDSVIGRLKSSLWESL